MNGSSPITTMLIITRRELVRYIRQPARIAAAVGTPALIWLFLASGFADAMQPQHLEHQTYSLFVLPGMMTLVAVFASIFASIAIIEDRAGGWLQTVLVSPAPRWSIALGRVLGGAVVATVQALLLLLALPFIGGSYTAAGIVIVIVAVALTSVAMTGLGLLFAWQCESTGGFHSVMNLLLMPLWLLSGAFFPAAGAATWLKTIIEVNPLTWCTDAIRQPLLGDAHADLLIVPAIFAGAMLAACVAIISIPSKRIATM